MSDHLAVLVHGLWGNPDHMWYVKKALTDRHPKISVLVSAANIGNRTYDGVDVVGERIAKEVLERVSQLAVEGTEIKRISFVGYSFGGLGARYAVGVLQSNEFFDKVRPVSFTTFATPHAGVSPTSKGVLPWLVSSLGPKTLSVTGAHIFLGDALVKQRPLLEVMSDEDGRYIQGLRRFSKRAAYANIVNDRSVPYFTAFFSDQDPFQDLTKIKLNHDEKYNNTLLDLSNPFTKVGEDETAVAKPIPLTYKETLFRTVMIAGLPIWVTLFSANALIANYKSSQRISMHRDEYPADSEADLSEMTQEAVEEIMDNSSEQPTSDVEGKLQLNEHQRKIVTNLNKLDWAKYQVHIQKTQHSHAAIVCRTKNSERLTEGHDVMRHWLDNVFAHSDSP